jgi:UV excision repair protein RAD23
MTGGVVLPENIIPPSLASQIPNLRPTSPPSAGGNAPRTGGAGRGAAQNPFLALRDNPMFASLQQLARNDPQRFQELMSQLIQSNPQLGQLLAQHGTEFMNLLTQGGGGGGGPRPQGIQLQITPQDQEALQRLTSLGFSRNRAIEAYFLFEKSEDAAANYLLNTKDDEDEMEFLEGDMEDDDNPDDAN